MMNCDVCGKETPNAFGLCSLECYDVWKIRAAKATRSDEELEAEFGGE